MLFHAVSLSKELESVSIVPISDVHPGDDNFDEHAFKSLIRWISENNAYCVLNGDLINAATKGSKSDVYSARMNPGEELKYMTSALKAIKDRILAVNIGNHEERIYNQDGVDMSELLADKLGVFYSREGLVLKVSLGKRRRDKVNHSQDPAIHLLYITHGFGGGKKPGSKLNNLESLAMTVVADCYIIGHVHQIAAMKNNFYMPDPRYNKIVEQTRTFVSCGSFMKWGGYAQRLGFTPGTREMPIIELSGREKMIRVKI